jgi:hypothetical protein
MISVGSASRAPEGSLARGMEDARKAMDDFGISTGPNGEFISMDRAIGLGADHVGGVGIMELTGNGYNFQFRNTFTNAAGEIESRIGRFDINPASPHVQLNGPHLNLEVQVNGVSVKPDPHYKIDPKTIRPGDFP